MGVLDECEEDEAEGMRLAVGFWEVREGWDFCGLGASVEGAMGKGRWGKETSWEEVKRSFKDVCVLGWGSGRGSER